MRLVLTVIAAVLTVTLFADSAKSADAIVRLLNSRSSGSPRAYEEASKIVREDADKGKSLQRFVLAIIATEKNPPSGARMSESLRQEFLDKSRPKLRKLAETQNNALAWYVLSLETNDVTMLEKAAAGGNVQALNAYGTISLAEAANDPGITTNEMTKVQRRAFKCFKRASDQGDINGFYNLGMCYMNGYGCKQSMQRAFDCFCAAADRGHPEAINNLGGFYRDGIIVPKDLAISVIWFKKSCDLGNPFGKLNYALALLSGEGIKQNQQKAVEYFKELSEEDENPEAMNLYGMCMMRGTGIDKDEVAAFEWFVKSAAKGFPMAMDNLAHCYENGVGIKEDMEQSMIWRMRSRAAAGDRTAARWLEAKAREQVEAEGKKGLK